MVSSAAVVAPRTQQARIASMSRGPDRIAAACAGDMGAFESLYREHVGRIHALCRRMAPEGADVEGLTQEVFVRAWEKLSGFRREAELGTWLHRIAINTVLNHRRSRSRRPQGQPQANVTALEVLADDRPPVGGDVDLERAIGGLPERARMVFVLHDVEGYRHEEIAKLMDLAPGTSKSQLHRARKLLREALTS